MDNKEHKTHRPRQAGSKKDKKSNKKKKNEEKKNTINAPRNFFN